MGNVDKCGTDLVVNSVELEEHILAQFEVESRKRFVEEQEFRTVDKRPCYRHALFLSAADCVGHTRAVPFEADDFEHFFDLFCNLVFGHTRGSRAEGDVVPNTHMREEGVVLENRVDFALVRRKVRNIDRIEKHFAAFGVFEAARDSEHCGFAATARTEKREHLSATNAEAHVLYDVHVSVIFFNIFKLEKLAHFSNRKAQKKYDDFAFEKLFFQFFFVRRIGGFCASDFSPVFARFRPPVFVR